MNSCKVIDLGTVDYKKVWEIQEQYLQKQIEHKHSQTKPLYDHYLILCQHPPVITLGKSGDEKNLLLTKEVLKKRGVEYYKTNRGGDITFHGPGQIVGYPIFDLEKIKPDISFYIRNLEEIIIQTLLDYGVTAERSTKETGVWIDTNKPFNVRKICAIGVRCSRWVTMHGFAFNINTDLNFFNLIIPCGINDKKVTSLQNEIKKKVDESEVKKKVMKTFYKVFNLNLV